MKKIAKLLNKIQHYLKNNQLSALTSYLHDVVFHCVNKLAHVQETELSQYSVHDVAAIFHIFTTKQNGIPISWYLTQPCRVSFSVERDVIGLALIETDM